MTKEAYFDMCEQMGTEPEEDEIPVEVDDFPELVQQAFVIYNVLADQWDGMSGQYMGKDYSIVFNLYVLYGIDNKEEQVLVLMFLQRIDSTRSSLVSDKLKAKAAQK